MKKNKRILRLILAVMLCVMQLPLFAHAESAPVEIKLGDLTTTQAGEGWAYDHATTTLTLGLGEFVISGEFDGKIKLAETSTARVKSGQTVTLGQNAVIEGTGTYGTVIVEQGAKLVNNGTITGVDAIECAGEMSGSGITAGKVVLTGTITEGTFGFFVEVQSGGIIENGTFRYNVFVNGGEIQDGLFESGYVLGSSKDAYVYMERGEIQGGTFHCTVANPAPPLPNGQAAATTGVISGGTFTKEVNNSNGGRITGGTFSGPVKNSDGGIIEGGAFSGTVTNGAGGVIEGGTFSDSVKNSAGGVININDHVNPSVVISGNGKLVNEGGELYHNRPTLDDMQNAYYTGNAIPADASNIGDSVTPVNMGGQSFDFCASPESLAPENWTITYEKGGEAVSEMKDVGLYSITYENAVIDLTLTDEEFNILQSGTAIEPMKAYRGDTETTAFTYGDTVIVKLTISATGEAPVAAARLRAFAAPAADQVAIFAGDVQLTEPQDVVSGQELVFEVTGLNAGTHTLTANYVGGANMAGTAASVDVTVAQKSITPEIKADLSHDIYTGASLTPTVTVKDGDTVLDPSEYTVTYKSPNGEEVGAADIINAGTYTAVVRTADLNYTFGEQEADFTIKPRPVEIDVAVVNPVYTGSRITPSVEVTTTESEPGTLIAGTDYTVSYGENVNVSDGGSVTVSPVVGGNYAFDATPRSFDILPKPVTPAVAIGGMYFYDGSAHKPSDVNVVVTAGDMTLVAGRDYTVSYGENIQLGDGTVTVTETATGNFAFVPVPKTFPIVRKVITPTVTLVNGDSYEYTGSQIKPAVTVTAGGRTLSADVDYTVAYGTNVEVDGNGGEGKGRVFIYPADEAAFTFEPIMLKFNITKKQTSVTVAVSGEYTYSGARIKPDPSDGVVSVKTAEGVLLKVGDLVGTDANVTYGENISAGKGTVTVLPPTNGDGSYEFAPVTYEFPIAKATVSGTNVIENIAIGAVDASVKAADFKLSPAGGTFALKSSEGVNKDSIQVTVGEAVTYGFTDVAAVAAGITNITLVYDADGPDADNYKPLEVVISVNVTASATNVTAKDYNGVYTGSGISASDCVTVEGGIAGEASWSDSAGNTLTDYKPTNVSDSGLHYVTYTPTSGDPVTVPVNVTITPKKLDNSPTLHTVAASVQLGNVTFTYPSGWPSVMSEPQWTDGKETMVEQDRSYNAWWIDPAGNYAPIERNYTPWEQKMLTEKGTITCEELTQDGDLSKADAGGRYQFKITFADGEPYDVIWSVSSSPNNTFIDSNGLLTIDVNETLDDLVVKAQPVGATADMSSQLQVYINKTQPKVTGVSVSPTTAQLAAGSTLTFERTVHMIGDANGALVWSISGQKSKDTQMHDYVLIIGADEPEGTIVVTATSWVEKTKFASVTVTVLPGSFELTATAGEGGAISPESTSVSAGDSAEFTIYPDAGFILDKLILDGVDVTDAVVNNRYTIGSVQAAHRLEATFKRGTYVVDLSAAPAAGGTVTGGGAYDANTFITVKAQANEGYRFVAWQENGRQVSTDASYAFSVTEGRELVAVFEVYAAPPARYSIKVQTEGGGSAHASHGSAAEGQRITLTAIPDEGFRFVDWDVIAGGVTIGGDSFTMPDRYVIVRAVFEEDGTVHIHDWESKWNNDAAHHWHECEKDDCPISDDAQKRGYGAHYDGGTGVCKCGYLMDLDELPTQVGQQELTEVPEGLKQTEFNTVSKIEEQLHRVLTANTGYIAENVVTYDVALQFSTDGGKTWINATEKNFPAEGITVLLPYPAGTGKDTHDFVITHMYTVTSEKLGTIAGQTEQPPVTKLDDMMQVTLKGLSPVGIAWKPIETAPAEFAVTATADANGTITPASASVAEGGSISLTITPNSGYTLDTLILDGADVTAKVVNGVYTLSNVQRAHTLSVTFKLTETTPVDPPAPSDPIIEEPTGESSVEIHVGDRAELSVTALNAVHYQWYVDRGNGWEAVGTNSRGYTTDAVSFENDGDRYYCAVSGAQGTTPASSPIFTLRVVETVVNISPADDSKGLILWIGLSVIAAAALAGCGVVLYRRRKKH